MVIMACLGGVLFFGMDVTGLRDWLEGVNDALFCGLVAILPILGFPVSVLQIMAGLKFGFWGGTALISISILFHLLGSYALGTGVLRRPIERLLSRTKYRLPEFTARQQNTIALLVPFLPGSYTVKNYLMVLGGVSLWSLLWIALPVYALRASSGIFLGDAVTNPSPWVFALLIAARVIAMAVSAWIIKRHGKGFKLNMLKPVPAELPSA